jgi:hypothetical protein
VKELEGKLKDIFSNAGKLPEALAGSYQQRSMSDASSLLPNQRETPTIFDKAQENIFKLMSTDSFPRYFRSEEYQKLCAQVNDKKDQETILIQEGLIAANTK